MDSSFDEISGGEKQRIGIMICKLLKRDIMLLDEPTSALDKVNLGSVVEYLCAENETTMLSASHDDEWLRHCDNIIELWVESYELIILIIIIKNNIRILNFLVIFNLHFLRS